MSMFYEHIRCARCDKAWTSLILWGLWQYALPSGRKLPVHRVAGWCRDCADVVPFECLPVPGQTISATAEFKRLRAAERARRRDISIRRLTVSFNWLRYLASGKHSRTSRDRLKASRFRLIRAKMLCGLPVGAVERARYYAAEARMVDEFYEVRSAPPKCLKCGSADVREVGRDLITEHPGCGGRLYFRPSSERASMMTPDIMFTPHGIAMPSTNRGSGRRDRVWSILSRGFV
jgi:hypothetical protein